MGKPTNIRFPHSPSNSSKDSRESSAEDSKVVFSLDGSGKRIREDGVVKSFESYPPPSPHSHSPGENLLSTPKGGSGDVSPGIFDTCSIPKHTPTDGLDPDSGERGGVGDSSPWGSTGRPSADEKSDENLGSFGGVVDPREPSEIPVPRGEVFDPRELEELADVDGEHEQEHDKFVVSDDRFDLIYTGEPFLSSLEVMGFDRRRAGAHIESFYVKYCRMCEKYFYFPRVAKDDVAKGLGVSLNPYMAIHNGRCSAGRTFGQLELLDRFLEFDLYVSPMVLTFPEGLSKCLEVMGEDSIEKSWDVFKRFRAYLGEALTKEDSKLGLNASLHPWSSKRPLDPHYHFHVTLPNVAVSKNGSGIRQFHRIRPLSSVRESDRELVRECWREALNDVFPGFMEDFGKELNIWLYPDLEDFEGSSYWKVGRDKNQIKNWLRYCRRGYALDLAKFCRRKEFYGEDLTERMKEFGRLCMEYTHGNNNNARPYGWWISPGMTRVKIDARSRFELRNDEVDIRKMCEREVWTNWNYSDREKLRHLILQSGRVSMGGLRMFCRYYLSCDWEGENVKELFLHVDVCGWDKEREEFCLVYPKELDNKGERGVWREGELVKIESLAFEKDYCIFCGEELLELENEDGEKEYVDGVPSEALLVRKGDVVVNG